MLGVDRLDLALVTDEKFPVLDAQSLRQLGVRCEVFVPESSSRAKRDRLAQLGALVTVEGASYADALMASLDRPLLKLGSEGPKSSFFRTLASPAPGYDSAA